MEWVRERDLLIAQTLAFVQSVSGKQPDVGLDLKPRTESALIDAIKAVEPPDRMLASIQSSSLQASSIQASSLQASSIQVARPSTSSEFRNEIRTRVASFRAHQERFNREREAYCSATLAKVRAAIADDTAPVPLPK